MEKFRYVVLIEGEVEAANEKEARVIVKGVVGIQKMEVLLRERNAPGKVEISIMTNK